MLKAGSKISLIFLGIMLFFGGHNKLAAQIKTASDSLEILELIQEAQIYFESAQYEIAIDILNETLQNSSELASTAYPLQSHQLMAACYQNMNQVENAIKHYLKALQLAEKRYDYENQFRIYWDLGILMEHKKSYRSALQYYLNADKIIENMLDSNLKKKLYHKIAENYIHIEERKKAFPFYESLVEIYEKENDDNSLIYTLRKIAEAYNLEQQFTKALDVNLELLEIYKKHTDMKGISITENNIGYIYTKLGEYQKALIYFQNVQLLDEQLDKPLQEKMKTNLNLGIAYQNTGDFDQAVSSLLKVYQFQKSQNNYTEVAKVANLIALVYLRKNDYHNAKDYIDESIQASKIADDPETLQVSYRTASEIARDFNDFETAMEYYQQHLQIKDSLLFEERISQQKRDQFHLHIEEVESELNLQIADEEVRDLSIRQLKLEADKREKEIALLKNQQELQELDLKKQELEKERALQDLLLTRQELEAEKKDQAIKMLEQDKELQQLALTQKELQEKERQSQIAFLEQQRNFQSQQLARQKKIRTYSLGLIVLGTVVIILMTAGYFNIKRTSQKLSEQKEAIELNNKELEQKSEEIMSQNELLEKQNQALEQQRSKTEEAFNLLNKAHEQLKNAQSKMVEQEKMASLGQLTAGIAHEINNPINFVSSNVSPLKLDLQEIKQLFGKYELLKKSVADRELLSDIEKLEKEIDVAFLFQEIDALLKGIEEGANRTKDIVSGLRKFSRIDKQEISSGNIHEGLDSTLLLLKNHYKNRIDIIKDYDPKIPLIQCYTGRLNQVFMNIINNAIQAIESEGTITIKTQYIRKNEDESVEIKIKDTGKGISKDLQNKIFDPFFTTKDVGEGTGLGLSISYGIIQQHHGRIEVNSTPGKGTEFIITLPVELTENITQKESSASVR